MPELTPVPSPPRVWALRDGRVAVALGHRLEQWLLVDEVGRMVVAEGELAGGAVELRPYPRATRL